MAQQTPSTSPKTDSVSILRLRAALDGRVISPGDVGYDEARAVFHGGIDRRRPAIVRPADAANVSRVVSLARESRLELAVAAGHGTTEGGILLDLSSMKGLEIDVERRIAWARRG
jgi:FAD/FMN-containing dehydrogenase